jgi:membrane protein insertase Oxa1/YidC/SpoIIIJ
VPFLLFFLSNGDCFIRTNMFINHGIRDEGLMDGFWCMNSDFLVMLLGLLHFFLSESGKTSVYCMSVTLYCIMDSRFIHMNKITLIVLCVLFFQLTVHNGLKTLYVGYLI